MSANNVTFRVPVVTYKDITLSKGLLMLLKHALFPPLQWNDDRQVEFRPNDQKVLAIKAVRADTGFGLKEAKDLVDGMTLEILDAAISGHDQTFNAVTLGELLRSKL